MSFDVHWPPQPTQPVTRIRSAGTQLTCGLFARLTKFNGSFQMHDSKIIPPLRRSSFFTYISPGPMISLTSYFSVPKGDSDIRLMYDGTKSSLNNSLWAPWFPLPTIESHLRSVEASTYMGDIDISEMFLNFMLHPRLQPYARIDLTPYFGKEESCV